MKTKTSRPMDVFSVQPLNASALQKASFLALGATLLMGSLTVLPNLALAEDKFSLTGNAAVVSDYRYRGLSQTRFDPALQVGADLGLPNGLYAGVWATNIKWIKDAGAGGKGASEIDLYGGYKTELSKDLLADIGVLRYQYPGNNYASLGANDNANTTELYAAMTFGPATLKYSHAVTSLFGFKDSKGSHYLDLSASVDLGGGWMVMPHLGRQTVDGAGNGKYSYTDYSLGVTKDFSGVLLGITAVGTNVKNEADFSANPEGKFLGKSGVVLSAKYNF